MSDVQGVDDVVLDIHDGVITVEEILGRAIARAKERCAYSNIPQDEEVKEDAKDGEVGC